MATIGLTSKAHVIIAIAIVVISIVALILMIVRTWRQRAYEMKRLLITKEDLV